MPPIPKKKTIAALPIDAYTHDKTRPNIPTPELSGFATDDEKKPKKIRYAYDPSLSPQLYWAGKAEQDEQGLEVESVPIYIQEKIAPQALFGDFNGITFDKLVEFY